MPDNETITLERIRFACMAAINADMLRLPERIQRIHPNNLKFDVLLEQENHLLLLRLTANIFARREAPVVIEYPADWWQACRQRWLPRWPVRMTRHTVKRATLFPQLTGPAWQQTAWIQHIPEVSTWRPPTCNPRATS